MPVDLARNDLSRIAQRGTVSVTGFMRVEDYSRVMHIVSDVTGVMKPEASIIDAFRSSFPAGTVTGAPEVRAVEIINEVETIPREAYAGAVWYFGFNKTSDTCITIRSAFFDEDGVHLQAGAGIVYDSVHCLESMRQNVEVASLMMTPAKCRIKEGSIKDVKTGMKVYAKPKNRILINTIIFLIFPYY